MDKPKPGEPWAYVAHKDGEFAGAAAGTMKRHELKKFLGEFVVDGFQIATCPTQAEYLEFLGTLRPLTKG